MHRKSLLMTPTDDDRGTGRATFVIVMVLFVLSQGLMIAIRISTTDGSGSSKALTQLSNALLGIGCLGALIAIAWLALIPSVLRRHILLGRFPDAVVFTGRRHGATTKALRSLSPAAEWARPGLHYSVTVDRDGIRLFSGFPMITETSVIPWEQIRWVHSGPVRGWYSSSQAVFVERFADGSTTDIPLVIGSRFLSGLVLLTSNGARRATEAFEVARTTTSREA